VLTQFWFACLGSPCSVVDFFFLFVPKRKEKKKGLVCVESMFEYVEALGFCCCHDWMVCVNAKLKGV
jgi:predicted nucleic acid-binding Zn finger protein